MRIVILATRIAGNDGVSLEAAHWKGIFSRMGHKVTLIAGELDRRGILIPELHFQSSEVAQLHDRVVYGKEGYRRVEKDIFKVAGALEGKIREIFNNGKRPDLLILPNVLSLPMHFPLAVAITRVIDDLKIPSIARHHDFWWERKRYLKSSMFPFFKEWFPPDLPTLTHVVINSLARDQLKKRTGIDAEIIWDSFDFSSKLNIAGPYAKHFRSDFGIAEDETVFLQPTRIVPRKRIELSIDLIEKLNNPKAVLVVAGRGGDEGSEYEEKIRKLAASSKARIVFVGERVNSHQKIIGGRRFYTFWDCYVNCDFITYPTQIEGFGNQFVESIYFKKPIVVTPYPVYKRDIRPLGFEVIEMPVRVTAKVVSEVSGLMQNPEKVKRLVENNFELGKKCFSYEWVEKRLQKLFLKMNLGGV